MRRALHELGTEPGRPRVSRSDFASLSVATTAEPALEPTVRRAVPRPAAGDGDYGLGPDGGAFAPLEPGGSRHAALGPAGTPSSSRPRDAVLVGVVPLPEGGTPFAATVVRPVSSERDPLIGATLGEYRVLARLGSGGMGLVYRGEQPLIGRPVAIKVLRSEYAQDPNHARRAARRGARRRRGAPPGHHRRLQLWRAPAGEPYLVMELLEGDPLDALMAREGRCAPKEALPC